MVSSSDFVSVLVVETHPESPRMITFRRTFFLDVIVSQLREKEAKRKHEAKISTSRLI